MVAGKKNCPYCAEVIMADAILCKHCQSNLGQKVRIAPEAAPRSEGKVRFPSKLLAGIMTAVALYWAFGVYLRDKPQNNEEAQVQDAIDRCRQEVESYSGPALGKSVIADACQKLEHELRKSFSHAP